jgi:NitT/TauT family transport system permease protein
LTGNSAKALALPLAVLLALEVWARATHLQSDSLAPPSEIVMALFGAFADLSILAATRDTLFSAFAGLAIGTVIGLALGIAFGIFDTLNRLMEVTVEAIRPIPSIALLPIALIALGFGYRMEIVICDCRRRSGSGKSSFRRRCRGSSWPFDCRPASR